MNNNIKLLVTGSTGQLGYDVVREGLKVGFNVVGIGSQELDITNKNAVSDYITKSMPDIIIHCAAYTNVDKAEEEIETSHNVNVKGTKNLVEAAKENNVKFMYISTDYVYNGSGTKPKNEESSLNPLGQYGRTKLQGEKIVKRNLDNWFIIRTSWVFGINGNNFVKTMLHLGESRNEVSVVGDQFGSPTYTVDLAKALIGIIKTDKYGIYNISNEGCCSWAEFAEEIFKQANSNVRVKNITTEEFPTLSKRPKNSKMSKEKLVEKGFSSLPSWQDALRRYLKNYLEVD